MHNNAELTNMARNYRSGPSALREISLPIGITHALYAKTRFITQWMVIWQMNDIRWSNENITAYNFLNVCYLYNIFVVNEKLFKTKTKIFASQIHPDDWKLNEMTHQNQISIMTSVDINDKMRISAVIACRHCGGETIGYFPVLSV